MLVELKDVYYRYNPDEEDVLQGINIGIEKGEFVALVGHTGSGKSTLVQTVNGLIKPTAGHVYIDGKEIGKDISYHDVRRKVGLVFQYPEHQLFEETIYEEIAFGPKNLGLDDVEIERRVRKAMDFVLLDYDDLKDRSPFGLSGGQKRRVAIAGVLSMEPEVLILDEPIAGLDPRGRRKLLDRIEFLNKQHKITVLLISHRMEEAATRAERLFVMNKGRIVLAGTPGEVFRSREKLLAIGLGLPPLTEVLWQLNEKGCSMPTDLFRVEEVEAEILRYWGKYRCSEVLP